MRNFLIALAIVAVVGTGGAFATSTSALTADELQTQIRELLAKVAELTKQLNSLRGQDTTTSNTATTVDATTANPTPLKHHICSILYRNLAQGISGDDVSSLQDFLRSEGYLNAEATGYFGSLTAQAVAKWQAAQGVSVAGSFGPLSRERIKAWCNTPGQGGGGWINNERFSASPVRGEAPLSVVFETWVSGFPVPSIYYTIDFGDGTSERTADCYAPADACQSPGQNKHTYSAEGTYTATLNKIIDPCPDDGDPNTPRCLAAIHQEVVGKAQIHVGQIACTKEHMPVCGSKPIVCITTPCNPIQQTYDNRCMMKADGATFLYEGQCRTDATPDPSQDRRCKAWYDGCNNCSRETPDSPAMCTLRACFQQAPAYCTAHFEGKENKPPVISGFSGPTTLKVNDMGTWSLQASDPENASLSYRITWGDEQDLLPYATSAGQNAFVQTATFTHSYTRAGIYTVVVVVRDGAGSEAKTSATIRVGNDLVACTQEAKQCPDGSYVGRTGPNCEFATCPVTPLQTIDRIIGASCIYNGTTYVNGQSYTFTQQNCALNANNHDVVGCTTQGQVTVTKVCRNGQWMQ